MQNARLTVGIALGMLASALPHAQAQLAPPRTQIRFAGPSGMEIRWQYRTPEGKVEFSKTPLEAPARYAFLQGGTYRLKLSRIPGHPGLELYPTLEVPIPGTAAQEFLAHNSVRLELAADDIRDVLAGMQVAKTLYLPGARPGFGNVLLVFRIGNVDLEAPGGKK